MPVPNSSLGNGMVFSISSNGTVTTLYEFSSQSGCTDGSFPGALIRGNRLCVDGVGPKG
jgi:hypothetical protein